MNRMPTRVNWFTYAAFMRVICLVLLFGFSSTSRGQSLKKQQDNLTGKWGFIDLATQTWAVEPEYDSIGYFYNGLASIHKNGKAGYIQDNGQVLIPLIYDGAEPFNRPIAAVKKGDKWGYINAAMQMMIPFDYDKAEAFWGPVAAVNKQGKWGFIRPNGKVIVPIEYDNFWHYEGGYMKVQRNGMWGLYDTTGTQVLPTEYEAVKYPTVFMAPVKKNGLWGCFDLLNDTLIVPYKYTEMSRFYEGRCYVCVEGGLVDEKCGYIDYSGREVIPISNFAAHDFHSGVARVRRKGRYGYIDKQGKFILPIKFSVAADFKNGVAEVRDSVGQFMGSTEYLWGLIDTDGMWVVKPTFTEVRSFSEGYLGVKYKGRWGFIDATGKFAIPPLYDWIEKDFNAQGYAQVKIIQNGVDSVFKIDRYGNYLGTVYTTSGITIGDLSRFDQVEHYKVYYPAYYYTFDVYVAQKAGKFYIFNQDNLPVVNTAFNNYRYDASNKTLLCMREDRPGKEFRVLGPAKGEWRDTQSESSIVNDPNPFNLDYSGLTKQYLTSDYFQQKTDEYMRLYNAQMQEERESVSRVNCNICSVCFGFGTNGTTTLYDYCPDCGGTGTGGYDKSVVGGYLHDYTYYTSNPCWRCNGSGSVSVGYDPKICYNCHGTGCEE